jgi:hypothetical protein
VTGGQEDLHAIGDSERAVAPAEVRNPVLATRGCQYRVSLATGCFERPHPLEQARAKGGVYVADTHNNRIQKFR